MSSQSATIGIDCRDGLCYVARVVSQSGRPRVEALARFEKSQLNGHRLLKDADISLAVPDHQVQVKELRVAPSGDIRLEELVRFELSQTVLEPEHEFVFDSLSTRDEEHRLGTIVRRSVVSELFASVSLQPTTEISPASGQLRAIALGRGWLNYCRRDGGELVALVDFTGTLASLALVYHDYLVSVGHLKLDHFDLSLAADRERMAAELGTVMNFRLLYLRESGISVPLSSVIISGDRDDGLLAATLGEKFSAMVLPPTLSSGYFPDSVDLAKMRLDRYLPALGLTGRN